MSAALFASGLFSVLHDQHFSRKMVHRRGAIQLLFAWSRTRVSSGFECYQQDGCTTTCAHEESRYVGVSQSCLWCTLHTLTIQNNGVCPAKSEIKYQLHVVRCAATARYDICFLAHAHRAGKTPALSQRTHTNLDIQLL